MTSMVRLSQLEAGGDINSRSQPMRSEDLQSLVNSINQNGLILPLSVRPHNDKWQVIDGNRRYAALVAIALADPEDPDPMIPVHVAHQHISDVDAAKLSLVANVERVNLHPMDEYEAFAKLEREGKSVADIALSFGISERKVKQRLALGNVIPEIRNEYRAGNLDSNIMKAAANADPSDQAKAWKQGLRGWQLRDALEANLRSGIHADSQLARFVGRDRYVAEGGTFFSDLFVDAADERWANAELATLVAAKVFDERREQWLAEGWSFVERAEGWRGVEQPDGLVNIKLITDKDDLKNYKKWGKKLDETPDDEEHEDIRADLVDAMQEIEDRYNAVGFSDEQKQKLGIVVNERWDVMIGAFPKVRPKPTAAGDDAEDGEAEAPAEKIEPPYSGAVESDLNAWRTYTVQGQIESDPHLAKCLLVDKLYLSIAGGYSYSPISIMPQMVRQTVERKPGADDLIEKRLKKAKISAGDDFAVRMKSWAKLENDVLDEILAWLVARFIMTIGSSSKMVDLLAKQGRMNVLSEWKPDIDNFFSRLSMKQLKMIEEDEGMKVIDAWMKKADAAGALHAALPEGWLPKALRY